MCAALPLKKIVCGYYSTNLIMVKFIEFCSIADILECCRCYFPMFYMAGI
jgi:hypothetical protein